MFSLKESHTPLRPVFTVAELTGQVKELLETAFDFVYVAGEVSNAKQYQSGHWYFSLKDEQATLPCVCFKNSGKSLKFKLEDGLAVIARGKLSVYPPRGAYQMVVTSIEPVGIGECQLAFEQLKAQLASEGLLDIERKRSIPMLPKKIGVVTSPVGAAIRDIINTIERRNKIVDVVISPAKVQGEGSAESIVEAIDLLATVSDLDAIIIARGGGSIEDLWSFNSEMVARAVASCRVPTISGVGHETDVTICDLVADLRAPTPTAAAELVARGLDELLDKWGHLTTRLDSNINDRIERAKKRMELASPKRSFERYRDRLSYLLTKVEHYQQRLDQRIEQKLLTRHHMWMQTNEKLKALAPFNVLSRGFSVIQKSDGTLVREYSQVAPGETLTAILEKGTLELSVTQTKQQKPINWGEKSHD